VLAERARLARGAAGARDAAGRMRDVARLLEPAQAEVALRRDEVGALHALVAAKRLSLLAELRALYPIQEQEKGKRYAIRGIALPPEAAFAGAPEEQVSTALGYTAHVVALASKYLAVPLRYLPHHQASRSTMRDEVLDHRREWPLFWRGADRDTVKVGARMLQRDVQQLLASQGIAYVQDAHVLLNLGLLFSALLDVPVPDAS
jgi:hypothetical protein